MNLTLDEVVKINAEAQRTFDREFLATWGL
jgi:hypothetical protein